jgi:hypothetical protein
MDDADNLRALAKRRKLFAEDPRRFDWGQLCEVIPISLKMRDAFYKEYMSSKKTVLMGCLLVRFGLLDLRIRMRIMRSKDDVFYTLIPTTSIKCRAGFYYEKNFNFGTVAEREFFLRWCTDVWLRAYADGNGRMMPREIDADESEFHPVKSDRSLEPNKRGYYPWATAIPELVNVLGGPKAKDGYGRYGSDSGQTPWADADGVAEGSSRQGNVEVPDDEIDRIVDESSNGDCGVSGVPEALDRHDGDEGR